MISRLAAEKTTVQTGWLARTGGDCDCSAISDANPRSSERQSLVDIRGLGKTPTFKGESARFIQRLRKTTGVLIAAYSSAFRPVIEWVEDPDNLITNDALEQRFGPLSEEPVDDVPEKSEQVHVALLSVTDSESFDIVLGAALRRLVRRWDPLSGGRTQSAPATNLGSRSVQTVYTEHLVARTFSQSCQSS